MCCYFAFFFVSMIFVTLLILLDFRAIAIGPNNEATKPCLWNFDTKMLLGCVGLPRALVGWTSLVRVRFHHMANSSQHEERKS
jgi:hypothetical protein